MISLSSFHCTKEVGFWLGLFSLHFSIVLRYVMLVNYFEILSIFNLLFSDQHHLDSLLLGQRSSASESSSGDFRCWFSMIWVILGVFVLVKIFSFYSVRWFFLRCLVLSKVFKFSFNFCITLANCFLTPGLRQAKNHIFSWSEVFIKSDMGLQQTDYINRMLTLSVITISGFYCISLGCVQLIHRSISDSIMLCATPWR